jgi:hypothetical protein
MQRPVKKRLYEEIKTYKKKRLPIKSKGYILKFRQKLKNFLVKAIKR